MYINIFIFFFFSSRRRHTSFSRDWSSDVCSSDLDTTPLEGSAAAARPVMVDMTRATAAKVLSERTPRRRRRLRSEERRVGKECRSLWRLDHEKKKMMFDNLF